MTSQSYLLIFSICFLFTTSDRTTLDELLQQLRTDYLCAIPKINILVPLPTPLAGLGEVQLMPCQLLDKQFFLSLHLQKYSLYFNRIIIQEFGVTCFLKRTSTKTILFYIWKHEPVANFLAPTLILDL